MMGRTLHQRVPLAIEALRVAYRLAIIPMTAATAMTCSDVSEFTVGLSGPCRAVDGAGGGDVCHPLGWIAPVVSPSTTCGRSTRTVHSSSVSCASQ